MATLRQVLVGRPWWHSPVFWIAIIVALAATVAVLYANATVWDRPSVPSLPSLGEANQPAAQPVQQVPAVIAPIKVKWVKIGTARNGDEVLALPIPWNKIQAVFIPVRLRSDGQGYDKTKNDLGLEGSCSAQGDGVAFVAACVGDNYARFTPNRGVNWYSVQDTPGLAGATLEGDHITLFTYAQTEPWVYTYWRTEIPLSALEGLSR